MRTFKARFLRLVCLAAGSISCSLLGAGATNAPLAAVPQPGRSVFSLAVVTNRPPLQPLVLNKLPLGSIRPQGWVRQQLLLMANGFTGHLPEVSRWCQFRGSAWTSRTGEGQNGWEELPYWLKGYTDLGYILQDARIIGEARQWIDAILNSQQPDGYFGPKTNKALPDIWPNMIALRALRSHHEATGDPRVPAFMSKYFRWLATVPGEKLLPDSWQKWRGGDNLDSLFWLYNRTGEPWLLDLARLNHEHTADWTAGIPTWHGVNLTQGFREPAQFYALSRDSAHLTATFRNYDTIMAKYGQVPGGMFGADENARETFTGPRQGAETCSMVEYMGSDEMLLGITGDRVWADRCEDIAFNSLPASMTADLKGLHYLTAPNQVQLDHANKSPMIENEGDMFTYNPHAHRCCQHNVAFGWPYYSEHLWMETQNKGLAAAMYAPCVVTAKVGAGREVRIAETTDYPFDEAVHFAVGAAAPTPFAFVLRVPGWCDRPTVSLNGKPLPAAAPVNGWITIDRIWRNGDRVRLDLPMRTMVRTWQTNGRSVSVDRGPLTYSLKIGERWRRHAGTDRWPGFEVFPATPWNYALINPTHPSATFPVAKAPGPLPPQPFTSENPPLTIRARARRIPSWRLEANGLVAEVPPSPLRSEAPIEEVMLIPMGCARLRISAFPTVPN